MKDKILVINPGSTSTKVACFNNISCIHSQTLRHDAAELTACGGLAGQFQIRMAAVREFLDKYVIQPGELLAVVGRGGLLRPLKGGTYLVNKRMTDDLLNATYGEHASNLGALMANEIAGQYGLNAYIVNPVVVDELEPVARYSGLKAIERKSVFHALNQKAVACKAAEKLGRNYCDINLVIAHMGGGISVASHKKGKVVDVNNGLEEGAFSPERSGSLPVLQLVDLCFTEGATRSSLRKMLVGNGGLVSYLNTSDCEKAEHMMETGNEEAKNVLYAMAYQVAKEIGAFSAVLKGRVDAVVLTGGLAYSRFITSIIEDMVKYIAPVMVFPGEDEMLSLAEGVVRVLNGEEKVLEY